MIEPFKPLTVALLIEHLKTFDQSLPVAFRVYSENCLLDADHISIQEHCEARPDGWVANKRPDKPTVKYLMFSGN